MSLCFLVTCNLGLDGTCASAHDYVLRLETNLLNTWDFFDKWNAIMIIWNPNFV